MYQRHLQKIIITNPEAKKETKPPTRAPIVFVPRPTKIVVCTSVDQDGFAINTEVEYSYIVTVDASSKDLSSDLWEVSCFYARMHQRKIAITTGNLKTILYDFVRLKFRIGCRVQRWTPWQNIYAKAAANK